MDRLYHTMCDTWYRVQDMSDLLVALRHNLYALCRPASSAYSRRQLWDAYELSEERAMVYLQVCTTDQREMACDNRHMRIQP